MATRKVSGGVVHKVPPDVAQALAQSGVVRAAWESLTPLARNEWLCWVVSVKKDETRREHIKRMVRELREGARRPCCWMGCIHRTDKALSPSVRALLKGRLKK